MLVLRLRLRLGLGMRPGLGLGMRLGLGLGLRLGLGLGLLRPLALLVVLAQQCVVVQRRTPHSRSPNTVLTTTPTSSIQGVRHHYIPGMVPDVLL